MFAVVSIPSDSFIPFYVLWVFAPLPFILTFLYLAKLVCSHPRSSACYSHLHVCVARIVLPSAPEEMSFLNTNLYDDCELTYVSPVTCDERSTYIALRVNFSGKEISEAFKSSFTLLTIQPVRFHYTVFHLSTTDITFQLILCTALKTITKYCKWSLKLPPC